MHPVFDLREELLQEFEVPQELFDQLVVGMPLVFEELEVPQELLYLSVTEVLEVPEELALIENENTEPVLDLPVAEVLEIPEEPAMVEDENAEPVVGDGDESDVDSAYAELVLFTEILILI